MGREFARSHCFGHFVVFGARHRAGTRSTNVARAHRGTNPRCWHFRGSAAIGHSATGPFPAGPTLQPQPRLWLFFFN